MKPFADKLQEKQLEEECTVSVTKNPDVMLLPQGSVETAASDERKGDEVRMLISEFTK